MTEEVWNVYAKRADFAALAKKYGIDQVTARIAVNRDVAEADFGAFLSPSLSDLHDPFLMKDMGEAVEIVLSCIKEGVKIRVIGDYDVDGINSTYILLSGLTRAGAVCDYAIPRRIEDGYGVNMSMIEQAVSDGVGCILTCDNGIAAGDATGLALEKGMKVVVTDHHTVPYHVEADGTKADDLPPADAVVDPHRADCPYPFKEICGGTVAFKFISALFDRCGIGAEGAFDYIGNAAFATVCDVMPLKGENRIIVKYGLEALTKTENFGLRALIARTNLTGKSLTAYHCGFVLGPCFNATGRLATADAAMQLLLAKSDTQAAALAANIVTMNDERKAMTERGVAEGMALMEDYDLENNPVIVLFLPDIHESICGLVAGRIKEAFYHPTFVLTRGETCAKGSGRSIEAYPMYDRMKAAEDLYIKWGGHPMAAGLSIAEADVDDFRRRLNENPGLTEKDFRKKVMIDVPMPFDYLVQHTGVIDEMVRLEPTGTGNPKPLFAVKEAPVTKIRAIGRDRKFWKVTFAAGPGRTIDGLYFGDADEFKDYYVKKAGEAAWEAAVAGEVGALTMTLAYETDWNEYNGIRSPQILIRHFK